MTIQISEWVWLNEQEMCPASELIEVSGLTAEEFGELVGIGVIIPVDHDADVLLFQRGFARTAHIAKRLREDFELDLHGLGLAMTLMRRIEALQDQLNALQAQIGNKLVVPVE